ncbi:MAG: polysialyltransferase family glycosyltransferase [Eubacterium sp.]
MNNNLILCNSVFQVLVALWFKYNMLSDENTDIIISDHMNSYEMIAGNISKTKLFRNVYTVKSKKFVFGGHDYSSQLEKFFSRTFPKKELYKLIKIKNKYDCFYFSNFDEFSELIYDVLKRRNNKMKVNIYTDGTSTQSKLFEGYYNDTDVPKTKKYRIFALISGKKYLYGNVNQFLVFEPDLMEWDPKCEVSKIDPICKDKEFLNIVNQVFGYDNIEDEYSEKYIFFEESFYADSGYMEDIVLIEKLAEIVGKENLLIKIHPRNPKNRFKELGYKTNKDTHIPWEVIAMNIDLSGKKLIAIASSSILNPVHIFRMDLKAYSLINCLNEVPRILDTPLSKTVVNMYHAYPDNIKICTSLEDIIK